MDNVSMWSKTSDLALKENSDVEVDCHRHRGQSGYRSCDGDSPGPRFLGLGPGRPKPSQS